VRLILFPVVKAVPGYTRQRLWQWIWLGLAVTGWGGLVFLSHRPTPGAILWTNHLFGWVVLVSYVSLWGWWLVWQGAERRSWFRCLTVNLAVAIAWLGLELPAALNLINWGVLLDRLIAPQPINHQYRTAFVLDRELAYRRPPHVHWSGPAATDLETDWLVRPGSFRDLTFTYDARGYRNSTNRERAEVALLGDSSVDGWYVTDRETAASVLEAELGKPVANLGVAGYGPMQELIVLKREVPRLRPSVVAWFFFEGNDFYDDWACERTLKSLAAGTVKSYGPGQPVARAHPWRQRALGGNFLRLLRAWSDPLVPNRVPYFGWLTLSSTNRQAIAFANYASVPWSPWLAERWGQTKVALEEGARFCRQQGIRLILCYVPDKFRVYRPFVEFPPDSPCRQWAPWPLPADFAEFCRAAQIPFLDLTEALQESVRRGGMPYPPADSHWGPEGHKFVARPLHDQLNR
jgi:hypothetical protein